MTRTVTISIIIDVTIAIFTMIAFDTDDISSVSEVLFKQASGSYWLDRKKERKGKTFDQQRREA